jgi:hypothetical protein
MRELRRLFDGRGVLEARDDGGQLVAMAVHTLCR